MSCVEKLKSLYGDRVIFVGLYGSQNYGLATGKSDYDFKAIVAPTLKEIIYNKSVSTTIKLEDGLCDVKDIRLMAQAWKKQNVNFMELLFSDYTYTNSEYLKFIKPVYEFREEIVRLDENKALNCMKGFVFQKYGQLFKDLPSNHQDIVQYGYSAKAFVHMERMCSFIVKYMKRLPYRECLKVNSGERFSWINIKNYEPTPLSIEDIKEYASHLIEEITYKIDNAGELYGFYCSPRNDKAEKILDSFVEESIKYYLFKEQEMKENE
ncbi:MAG: hypothetical protein ACI39B_04360 [Methanobrevibacter smithii]